MRWVLIGVLLLAGCGGAVSDARGVVSAQVIALVDGGFALRADGGCPETH